MATKSSVSEAHDSGHNRVLYRKYRPTCLEDVVGQEQITRVLANALKQGKIAHAYLFIGPRGTGKTSIARIFAHAVNGFDYQIEDDYLDIIEIDAASNTGVDNIREIREKAVIAPTKGKYKVYIIDEVHMLTKSASNALLKTLEEPPEHVIFIMATTDAHKVPITISSRTQVYTFHLADPETMFQHLRKISDLEHIPITDDALKIIVRRGGGSFRDSLSLLDQVMNLAASLEDKEGSENTAITAEILNSALGLPQDQVIAELLQASATQNIGKIHDLLQNLLNSGTKPEIIASECIAKILENPQPNLLSLLSKLPDVQPPFPEAKLLLAFISPAQQAALTPSKKIPESQPTKVAPPVRKPPESPGSEVAEKSAPKIKSETIEKAPKEAPKKSQNMVNFDWNGFINTIHAISTGLANQLRRTDYEFDGKTLQLFPSSGFIKKILDKPENIKIITENLPGIGLSIHDVNEPHGAKDGTISQISAIMGGVQEVKKDEMPF